MVRTQVFNPEDVVQAGFDVVDAEGWDQLSARRVAEVLGSSTAPVYSNFRNMSELAAAVVQEAIRRFMAKTSNPQSGNRFLDFGWGVLDYALAHPRWYDALFREVQLPDDQYRQLVAGMARIMAATPELSVLPEFERQLVLKKMTIFTHGLASEICTGHAGPLNREGMRLLLEEVGHAVMDDALKRPPRSVREMEMLDTCQNCCPAEREPGKEEHHE
ncbi:hypothetical protein CSA17_03555 [bacterium DOLJORAL78_65_58]|nr:MAG: hypothetical protein CSB20_08310 [bacterium DOLZORAL124_64_63]PIE76183.1 MAG: hypothetical protein CSA17_03555 [bacterium DOLJORAL78_65_58]